MDLYSKCYSLVKQIPEGKVSTYKLVALALGDPIAARAVGVMMGENPYSYLNPGIQESKKVPCHRVVNSDGRIGGFTSEKGIEDKISLLEKEGVSVRRGRISDFQRILFRNFKSDYPLKKLRKEQNEIGRKAVIEDRGELKDVGIIDVAYKGSTGFGAMVVISEEGNIIGRFHSRIHVKFPYIPTYLAYRELPLIEALLKEYRPSVLIIDGNGILHPLRAGIATHAGVVLNIPTVGAAKSLLYGKLNGDRICLGKEHVGYLAGKYYVSPGNLISVGAARNVVKKYLGMMNEAHKEAAALKYQACL